MYKYFKILLLSFIIVASATQLTGQGYYVGAKAGISLNQQRWNNLERDILFTPFIDFLMESYDEGSLSSLYMTVGFHTRGSAIRGPGFAAFNKYKFYNSVLEVGGKRMISNDRTYNGYYILGLRLEYTLGTNFGDFTTTNFNNLVSTDFVRRLNYGLTVGGGFERSLGEGVIGFVELAVNPDLSKQYEQLGFLTYTDQFGMERTLSSQEVRNISLEVKVGVKFLRL